jgi:hypothetical protein
VRSPQHLLGVALCALWLWPLTLVAQPPRQLNARWHEQAKIVAVDFQEERAAVEAFLAGKAMPCPVFLDPDGTFARKYQISTLPGLLVIRDGKVLYRGPIPDEPDRVLSPLLSGS